jgi:putative ABC transport system permease protein
MVAWLTTGAAVALLAAIATVSLAALRVPGRWAVVTALARAALQLAAVSLVLAGIITSPVWVGVGLVVMFIAAVSTAARRSAAALRHAGPLLLSMLIGRIGVMTVAFATERSSSHPGTPSHWAESSSGTG